eukprot:SM000095S25014  [mRNA]  locus=s95:559996:562927:- [translate_table: standard]
MRSDLEHCFRLPPLSKAAGRRDEDVETEHLAQLFGSQLVSAAFGADDSFEWPAFLQGVAKCCKQASSAAHLSVLLEVFARLRTTATRDSDGCGSEDAGAPSIALDGADSAASPNELRSLFLLCWLMGLPAGAEGDSDIPDVGILVQGAIEATANATPEVDASRSIDNPKKVSLSTVSKWIMSAVPNLCSCLPEFVQERLQLNESPTNSGEKNDAVESHPVLLTKVIAWAIGLSQRGNALRLLHNFATARHSAEQAQLLYRSSSHGSGLSRFLARAEGYRELVLLLISARSDCSYDKGMPSDEENQSSCWMIGAIIDAPIESNIRFGGGNASSLLAIQPAFNCLRSTGKSSNSFYCYRHAPGAGYQSKPMPEGIGLGGEIGKERLWLRDDFEKLTVRHHAIDKSYQPGSFVPSQGYSTVEGQVLDVEAWGLGGKGAQAQQEAYQQREALFSEQRRKASPSLSRPLHRFPGRLTTNSQRSTVDLKAFIGEDSPDRVIAGMLSDPNKPQREDR